MADEANVNTEEKTTLVNLETPTEQNRSEVPASVELETTEEELKQGSEPILHDDLVDEEFLKEQEAGLTDEELIERLEQAKEYKKEGNDEFGRTNYQESILRYTKGLLICPLKEKDFRSILYANRSASKIKLGRTDLAIEDCTKSLENNPAYVRVLLRRAKLFEADDKLDEALADFQKVYELDPGVVDARAALHRLPPLIQEKNEKLKEEMLGKLKDLGNMILRPFGLSTDNFNLQQDPNSGGYSINFNK